MDNKRYLLQLYLDIVYIWVKSNNNQNILKRNGNYYPHFGKP